MMNTRSSKLDEILIKGKVNNGKSEVGFHDQPKKKNMSDKEKIIFQKETNITSRKGKKMLQNKMQFVKKNGSQTIASTSNFNMQNSLSTSRLVPMCLYTM